MRGEDHLPTRKDFSTSRSPPHARGRLVQVVHCLVSVRITPACAGKTSGCRPGRIRCGHHPRMRGEDTSGRRTTGTSPGSPPHARGRLDRGEAHVHVGGITPACAEKTAGPRPSPRGSRDHPRMRGEDVSVPAPRSCNAGSPPHARGRPLPRGAEAKVTGITPACAGKTCQWMIDGTEDGDHPRMRGEDCIANIGTARGLGSPPHARGRRWRP